MLKWLPIVLLGALLYTSQVYAEELEVRLNEEYGFEPGPVEADDTNIPDSRAIPLGDEHVLPPGEGYFEDLSRVCPKRAGRRTCVGLVSVLRVSWTAFESAHRIRKYSRYVAVVEADMVGLLRLIRSIEGKIYLRSFAKEEKLLRHRKQQYWFSLV